MNSEPATAKPSVNRKPFLDRIETNIYKGINKHVGEIWHTEAEMMFIDHIVMIWINRVRHGDRKVSLPIDVIKSKGKEVAKLVNESAKFYPTQWIRVFMDKLLEDDAQGPRKCALVYPTFDLNDIIKEEYSKFFDVKPPGSGLLAQILDAKIDPPPTQHYDINTHTFPMDSEGAGTKTNLYKGIKKRHVGEIWHTEAEMMFIDHVVMIWINGARNGDRKVNIPIYVIKSKGREVAKLVNESAKFYPTQWIRAFMDKLLKDDAREHRKCALDYPTFDVKRIIKEEYSKLFNGNPVPVKNSDKSENSKKINAESYKSSLVVQIEEQNDPIETYNEALDCLRLIKCYALSVQNFNASSLISDIEELLKD